MSRKPTNSIVYQNGNYSDGVLPEDMCPICKRRRYFNIEMEFLINPECYHAMCSQCVDNIFKSGPAQCPRAECHKTLRIRGFRKPFFADLNTEREVDIRKRVEAVFNRTEDEFETLRDYNNYLQGKEDLSFNLVYGDAAERTKAEEELITYEQTNKEEIEKNRTKAGSRELARKQREAEERRAAEERRLQERQDEERAKAEEASLNQEVMEALARGEPGSAAEIQARIVANKRAKLAQISGSSMFADAAQQPSLLSIRGLRQKKVDDWEDDTKPYDSFAGVDLEPTRYSLHDSYENPFLDLARTREDHRVPGYSVQEYVARAMFEAFAGLGVMVEDEKDSGSRGAGTQGARDVSEKNKTTVKLAVDDVLS